MEGHEADALEETNVSDTDRGHIPSASDESDSEESEKRHWHDVSRAFCLYEGKE